MSLPLLPIQSAMLFDEALFASPLPNIVTIPVRFDDSIDGDHLAQVIRICWCSQPAARVTILRDAAGIPVGQAPSPVASLLEVLPGAAGTIHLRFHHTLADRPGIEALLRRAAAALAEGRVPDETPWEDYAEAVQAVLRHGTSGAAADASDDLRVPLAPGDPLAWGNGVASLAVERVAGAVAPQQWARFARGAAARGLTEALATLGGAMRALDHARESRPSRIGIPLTLRDAIPDPHLLGCFMTVVTVATPGLAGRSPSHRWDDHCRAEFAAAAARRGVPAQRSGTAPAEGVPPFDLLFAWHDAARIETGTGAILPGMALPHPGRAPLALSVQPAGGGLEATLDFDPARIDRDAARALLGLFVAAVEERPHARLAGRSPAACAATETILAAIARRVEERPDAAAILTPDGTALGYRDLWCGAGGVARWAAAQPPGPILLAGRRGPRALTALLGLLRSGRPFALCEAEPAALADQARAIGAAALLGEGPPPPGVAGWNDLSDIGPGEPESTSGPGPLILFTSGSTGPPRPVVIGPEAIAEHCAWAAEAFRIAPDERALQFNAFGFDAILEEVLPTWSRGAAVVVRDDSCARSGGDLLRFCRKHRIALLNLPTGFFNLAWQTFGAEPWPLDLRLLVIGGEAYDTQALRAWRSAGGDGFELLTTYGPTETTIDVAAQTLGGHEPEALIGEPRPGIALHVLDRFGDPVADGLAGELHIGGGGARGYAGRPRETACAFVPDGFSGGGARLYRTGDRARRTAAGLRFEGRLDRQLKVAGRRLEPAPIEACLSAACGGAAVRLVASRDGAGLTGFVDAAPDQAYPHALDSALAALPSWQRPARLVFAPLPLTTRGKVDHAELARRAEQEADTADPAKSESPGWRLLREITASPALNPDDSFFSAGSRSLDVLRLVAQCRTRLRRSPSIQALYAAASNAQVARTIDEAEPWLEQERQSVEPGALVASPAEVALFADEAAGSGPSAYRIATEWRLDAPLDPARLDRAVERLRAYHPLLGARLRLDGDRLRWEPESPDDGPRTFDARVAADGAGAALLSIQTSHLVCDGDGLLRAGEALARLYRDDRDLPPVAPPGRSGATGAGEAAWRERTAGLGEIARLPADRPRLSLETAAVEATAAVGLGAERLESIGVSGTACLAALVAAWTARLTGADTVVVGVAGRIAPSDEAGVRLGVTTLPLIARPRATQSLAEAAAALADDLGWALAHAADAPAAVRLLRGQIGAGLPLLVDLEDRRDRQQLDFGTARATPVATPAATVRADVEVSGIVAEDGGLVVRLRGRASQYDRETLACWAASLASFAAAALAAPGRSLALATLGSDSFDRDPPAHAALVARRRPVPPGVRGAERLRRSLEQHRSEVIFVAKERAWTGEQILAAAASAAADLRALGVGPSDRVALRLARGVDYPIALLAAWSLGAVPVLLNPALPDATLREMETLSGAACQLQPGAAPGELSVVALASGGQPGAAAAETGGAGSAYAAFTSGSTGHPKMVLVGWEGLDRLLDWSLRRLGIGPGDCFLHVAAPGFDIGLFELWAPVVAGGRVIVAAPESTGDASQLIELCRRHRVTHLHFVPALLESFLDASTRADRHGLRAVMCGGEAVPVALQHRLSEAGIALHHCYGPTEASIFALSWFADGPPVQRERLPLGEPVDGAVAAIVDRCGWPTVRGAVGELVLAGDCVSRGYYRNPRATAARFRPAAGSGERCYHTGDRALMRADGSIEYVGRLDRQLKIGGVRIEPGEIEAALESLPSVARAVVVPDRRGELRSLVAFVVPRSSDDVVRRTLGASLAAALRDRLAPAAIPGRFVLLDELPAGPTGKIDFAALATMVPRREEPADEAGAPGSPDADPQVAFFQSLWSEALGVGNVGPDQDFFAAGGNSMAAIRLVARAVGSGRLIALADLFRHPTPRALAGSVRASRTAAEEVAAPGQPAALAPAARHWLARRRELRDGAVLTCLLALDEPASPERVEAALAELVERHDGLRIRVTRAAKGWAADFAPVPEFACPVVDSVAAGEAAARAAVDPAEGRLIAAALIGPRSREVVLAVHHLGADWQCLPLLGALLRTAIAGRAATAPPQPYSRVGPAASHDRATVALATPPAGEHRLVTRLVPLPAGVAAEAEERLAARLGAALRRRNGVPAQVAVEFDGRGSGAGGAIGWLAAFRFWGPARPEDPLAAEAVVNVVPEEAGGGDGLRPLHDAMVPAHPIAVELKLGNPGHLSVFVDAGWSAADLNLLVDTLADALSPGPLPLRPTALQRMMIAGSLAYPKAGLYHSQLPFAIEGEWDPTALAAAWDDAAALHEALRLRYALDAEGVPELSLHPVDDAARVRIESSPHGVEEALDALMGRDLAAPFTPGAPLSRTVLLHAADGARILWSHHHAIADGWSLNLVLESVARCYAARAAGRTPDAPPAPPRLVRYLRWWQESEAEARTGALAERIEAYAPRIAAPPPFRPAGGQAATRLCLGQPVSDSLRALAGRRATSLFELFVAALALVEARRTGRDAVAFEIVATVRPPAVPEVERIAGLCMNVLPCLLPVPRSLDALLAAVRTALAALHEAEAAPGERLAGLLRAHLGTAALETQLVFENYPGDRRGQPLGADGRLVALDSRERSFARFTVVVMPDDDIGIEILHGEEPAEVAAAASMGSQLRRVAQHLATSYGAPGNG